MTVVEACIGDQHLVLRAHAASLGSARIVIKLSPEDLGCLIVMSEAACAGPARWLHNPLTDVWLKRRNTEALARLAALAEARETPLG